MWFFYVSYPDARLCMDNSSKFCSIICCCLFCFAPTKNQPMHSLMFVVDFVCVCLFFSGLLLPHIHFLFVHTAFYQVRCFSATILVHISHWYTIKPVHKTVSTWPLYISSWNSFLLHLVHILAVSLTRRSAFIHSILYITYVCVCVCICDVLLCMRGTEATPVMWATTQNEHKM